MAKHGETTEVRSHLAQPSHQIQLENDHEIVTSPACFFFAVNPVPTN